MPRPSRRFLERLDRNQIISATAFPPRTFGSYIRRWFEQVREDIRERTWDTVLTLCVIFVVLIIQFRHGWIRADERWESVFVNLAPALLVFGVYVVYHLAHAAYALDTVRATDADLLIAGLGETERELEIERTVPRLEGRIHQVYFGGPRMETSANWDTGVDEEVAVQVSLGNVRPTETVIYQFSLRVTTNTGVSYEGVQISSVGIAYRETNSVGIVRDFPLEPWEVSKNPLPNGYARGHMEAEGWLYFKVTGMPVGVELERNVRQVTLLATDIFEITHQVFGVPPWDNRGEIVRMRS